MKEHIPAEPCFRECTPGLSPASSRPCFVHLTSDQHLTNAERRHNEPSPHKRLQKRRQARLEAGNRSCVHFIALILVKFFVSVRPATMLAAKTNIASYSQYNRPCSFFERIDPPVGYSHASPLPKATLCSRIAYPQAVHRSLQMCL